MSESREGNGLHGDLLERGMVLQLEEEPQIIMVILDVDIREKIFIYHSPLMGVQKYFAMIYLDSWLKSGFRLM